MKTEQERVTFEAWIRRGGWRIARCRDAPRDYTSPFIRMAWSAWKARAKLDGRS